MNGCEKLTNGGGVSSPSTLSVVMDGKLSTETKMPDADTIKMFVGQVPRSYDENDLLKIFGQYGPVHQLNILRDKSTNQSRDRKLFVGMLNKSMAEQDVQALFSPYGLIEDCAVLKDGQGQSRGEASFFSNTQIA
uniref:RRM domain-containing protein n=1 Tax=Romanomermis culicivorax TaxID=13658 RepID=A0A915IEW4_ROMCU